MLVFPHLELVSGPQAEAADRDRLVVVEDVGGFGVVLFAEPAVGGAVAVAGRRGGRVDVAHA